MTEFETGAVRDTGGKGRTDLLPMCALLRVARHMEDALTHYPERNWEHGLPMHSMLDSAMRHLMKYMDGQNDEDHLCAAATNLLMAMWTEEKLPKMQDIHSRICRVDVVQTLQPPEPVELCPCFKPGYVGEPDRCNGTKEKDPCDCHGDVHKCQHKG